MQAIVNPLLHSHRGITLRPKPPSCDRMMYGQVLSLQISLRHVQNDQLAQHNESLCFSSVFGKFRIANIYMEMVRCFRLREGMKLSQWCSARCGLVKEVAKVDIIFDASRISCARVPAFSRWIIHNTAV